MDKNTLNNLLNITIKAGEIIMGFYRKDITINSKRDDSPVTEADYAANEYIVTEMSKITSFPIIAEESDNSAKIDVNQPFWLVDPLDGTRGFIKHNDQFAVNIALIEDKKPSFGVIYIPVSQEIFYTYDNRAYKSVKGQVQQLNFLCEKQILITNKTHKNSETENFIHKVAPDQVIYLNSSIKFCYIAEGRANIYPRFGTTMEWDTAAGHALLNATGGNITTMDDKPFIYGKKDFYNGNFVAYGRKPLLKQI